MTLPPFALLICLSASSTVLYCTPHCLLSLCFGLLPPPPPSSAAVSTRNTLPSTAYSPPLRPLVSFVLNLKELSINLKDARPPPSVSPNMPEENPLIVEDSQPMTSPPPYSTTTTTTPQAASGSEPVTPLPSYHTSPVLLPTLTTVGGMTKLPLPALDDRPPPSAYKAHHEKHTPSLLTQTIARWAIALLGPTLVDLAFLTVLNFLGFAFTLLQLPLAIILAWQFNAPTTNLPPDTRKKEGEEGRRRFTQRCDTVVVGLA